ncbi:unnamed protein product [Dracunculus medinensis]|uniref:Reverse transcriptase domain-containing protein n=1 Tax=Dracunculus medinensis TaxID=318479 RepID=A0A0N4U3M3_DRAME|nr:unnamed protein product [Dracunculus medinensis]
MRPNQAGFRPRRYCADQIFTLRRVLEHRFRYLQLTCFIDFAAPFDSIDRAVLWRVMERGGVPEKIIRLIKAFYERTSAQVCIYGELTDSFEIRTDVCQGCTLSPTIFNHAIDWIMDIACRHSRGVRISPEHHRS